MEPVTLHRTKQKYGSSVMNKIFVLLTFFVYGLNIPSDAQFYPARVYGLSDGMPTNAIFDITQSSDGVMWFLTSKGVVNYNSLDWRLFADSLELPNTAFSVIHPSEDGIIWVAGQNSTSFVIKYYLNEQWHQLSIKGLPEIENRFAFDVVNTKKNGYCILLSYKNAVYQYDTQSQKLKSYIISNKEDFFINALSFKDNSVYIASTDGLFVLDSETNQHPVNKFITDNKEVLQFRWKNEALFLLGKNWLGKYESDSFEYLSTKTGVAQRSPYNKHNLTIDQFDRIFYSSNTSAKYFDKQTSSGKTLLINGRVLNARSNRIFVDIENNVWVGDHRGLFKFNVLRFESFNENIGLAKDEVTSIIQLNDEIILANSNHLNILKGSIIQKKLQLGTKGNIRVLDMAKTSSDLVYIASYGGGLLVYDGNAISKLNWVSQDGKTEITSVEFFNDKLFFSSNTTIYAIEDGIINKKFEALGTRNIQVLNDSTLVALTSTEGFLTYNVINGDTARYTSSKNTYSSVYSIINWRGQYYIATGGGLATIKDGIISPIFVDNKLNRVSIYGFLISKNDELIMGTNEGIFIWDGQSLINYNKSYGLIGDEVNRNALIQDNKGNVWIGTELGASIYNVDEDMRLKIKPNLNITKVISQKGTVLDKSGTELNHQDNTIEFNFMGVTFFDEEHITYRYKLEGFDADWIYIKNPNSNSVRYTHLPPGQYNFTVESSIANSTWSDAESISFNVNAPFYTKAWFLFAAIFFTLLLLYIIYRIRFYVILQNQKALQEEVAIRTMKIQTMNKEIQTQNEELKMQSEEIITTNERLESTVQERTRQLREQNEKLSEYAFINSHQLRAPICRIIGLLSLLKLEDKKEYETILQLLHETGIELDEISKNINSMLDNVDLSELEQANSIEVLNTKNVEDENNILNQLNNQ
ncbi:triple tyrosine motif-containing protein [Fulvivirga sp.]|uniref:ligand-binding sensor domain-containing protein n=1 Tax=Fulvivirga sp. TaxID=1931237 RepID=UPI0032EAD20D